MRAHHVPGKKEWRDGWWGSLGRGRDGFGLGALLQSASSRPFAAFRAVSSRSSVFFSASSFLCHCEPSAASSRAALSSQREEQTEALDTAEKRLAMGQTAEDGQLLTALGSQREASRPAQGL